MSSIQSNHRWMETYRSREYLVSSIHICSGTDEGGFAWLTLNYLLGHLGKAEKDTIAAIDLGGGSVQQAFALTSSEAKEAPEGYVTKLSGGGKDYSVYVHRQVILLT